MASVGQYSSTNVRPWNPPQLQTSQAISFNRQYVAPPRILPGLAQLDIDHNANVRVKTYTTDVSASGLVIHSDSWGDTSNYSVITNWLQLAPAALDIQSGRFSTQEDHPWNKPQPQTSRRINFAYPFVTPPKVLPFISELDIDHNANFRAKTYVTDIDTQGFTLHLDTWADTTLYSLEAYWVAYPEDRENTFSTTFNTTDVRPWDQPQLQTSKTIDFGGKQLSQPPSVFVGLNYIDIDKNHNLRIHTYVDNVSSSGLTWHVDGWADTILYSGGGSIVAFA